MKINRKIVFVIAICTGLVMLQSFKYKQRAHDKFTNLEVLPADITDKQLHDIMRSYDVALGVHCNYCHVSHEVKGDTHPEMDFAADDKPEKLTAREMMKMTEIINSQHLAKIKTMGDPLEKINCVTCHMGRTTPIASIDSLPQHPHDGNEPPHDWDHMQH